MAKVKTKDVPLPTRAQTGQTQLDLMMAIAVRNPDAYMALADTLTVPDLNIRSIPCGLVWGVTKAHVAAYGELPGVSHLRSGVITALDENPSLLTEDELDELNGLVDYIFDPNEHGKEIKSSPTHVKTATDTLRQFLQDLKVTALIKLLSQNGQIPTELPGLLTQTTAELATIDSLHEQEVGAMFSDGWEHEQAAPLTTTGVELLDHFTGGGWTGGEVIVFMGPYGSCKTSIAVHGVCGAINAAVKAYLEERKTNPDAKVPVVVLMFTEGSKKEYRTRLLSHAARVPWKRLNGMTDVLAELSRSKAIGGSPETAYEKTEFQAQVGDAGFESEYERVQHAVAKFKRHLVVLDCTSSDEASGGKMGVGGVPQLANVMRGHFRKHPECRPVCVYLDHISALADRMAEALTVGMDGDKLRLLLKNIPRQLVDMIAKPFNVPVGAMHQLSGEANSRSSAARMHHTDAAGCKSLAEYAAFAIMVTKPDDEMLFRADCTKHRREPPKGYRIGRLGGAFNRITDVSADFTVVGKSIVEKSKLEAQAAADLVPASQKKQGIDVDDVNLK